MSDTHKAVLAQKDSILEHPSILADAIDYIRNNESDGSTEAEKILVENYQGAIEFLFELGTWLTYIDEDAQSTRNIIESVVKEAILQNYDRSKAINCLTDDALAETMEWLSQMVESPTWRRTIYELAQHPRNEDCPFLSLAMPCIAVKENLIGELISVPLAWNTLEIFLKCVAYVLQPLLAAGEAVNDGLLMHSIAFLQPKRPSSTESSCPSVRDVTLPSEIIEFCVIPADERQLNNSSENSSGSANDMLSRFLLYEEYRKDGSPPVQLLRQPIFIALLADTLFASSDRLLTEQQEQYAYLYSYAAMTVELIDQSTDRRLSSDRSRVEEAKKEILEASRICRQWNNMSGSAISLRSFRDLPTLLSCVACRPVSFGVFRFVRVAFRTKRVDFELNLETMKPYCIVVNELAEVNEHLHPALLAFITELLVSSVEGMEDLSQVLNIAAPPYEPSFLAALHPLVTHPDISNGLRTGKDTEFVNDFLGNFLVIFSMLPAHSKCGIVIVLCNPSDHSPSLSTIFGKRLQWSLLRGTFLI
ncbi:hypothetical protein T265_12692 [Opisthorchis viverrini]|uniref:Negative elongation factor D n=1 Tax=Opisthorchis viverrini TaxID=6198 RepID=A0A075ABB0_OPIVI|nr:hypothetical protein T265_12692 [Opisthorchis viverrini]KER33110.1 hypothetical protein T265_12692 [Opisthorchis viverrini]